MFCLQVQRFRRLITLVFPGLLFVWFLTVPATSGLGQSRGSHVGVASHGGFGGHVVGGSSFGRMLGGSGFHNPGFRRPGLSNMGLRNPGFHNSSRRFRRDSFPHHHRFPRFDPDRDGDDDRDDFHFRNCFGFSCSSWVWGWPWWWSGDPWWSDSHSSYDQDQEQDLALANEMNQQSLEEQRERRKEERGSQARSDHQPQKRQDAKLDPPDPSTVLIFRDQHRQEIQNYGIVGTTLWAFAPQHTQKISLADLDIPATTRANDDRGIDFRLPGGAAQSNSPSSTTGARVRDQ